MLEIRRSAAIRVIGRRGPRRGVPGGGAIGFHMRYRIGPGGQGWRGRLFQQGGPIAGRTAQDPRAAALDGLGNAPVCDDRLHPGPCLRADSRRLGASLIRVPPCEIGAMRGRPMIREGMDGPGCRNRG